MTEHLYDRIAQEADRLSAWKVIDDYAKRVLAEAEEAAKKFLVTTPAPVTESPEVTRSTFQVSGWLPQEHAARKGLPMATGLLDYFPDALADVARLSKLGNDKHNPGEPLRWAREKSPDHADALLRHMVQRTEIDLDGVLHATKVAWRALAQLQLLIEAKREAGEVYPST